MKVSFDVSVETGPNRKSCMVTIEADRETFEDFGDLADAIRNTIQTVGPAVDVLKGGQQMPELQTRAGGKP